MNKPGINAQTSAEPSYIQVRSQILSFVLRFLLSIAKIIFAKNEFIKKQTNYVRIYSLECSKSVSCDL